MKSWGKATNPESTKPRLRLPLTPDNYQKMLLLRKLVFKCARWMLPSSGRMRPYGVSLRGAGSKTTARSPPGFRLPC